MNLGQEHGHEVVAARLGAVVGVRIGLRSNVFERRLKQGGPIAEVVVDEAGGDPGSFGDLLDTHAAGALAGDLVDRRDEQSGSPGAHVLLPPSSAAGRR